MAFDLSTFATAKYRFSFTGDEGTSYIAEIHQDAYTGSAATVDGAGRAAVQVAWSPDGENEYAPMWFSEATLQVYDSGEVIAGDLIGALDDVDDKFLLVIREDGGAVKWVGNIDPEGITYEEDGPIPLTISAVDGLGRLANRPYISATDGTAADEGATTLIAAIADCLNDTGFGLDFYVSSSMYHKTSPVLGATANPLENTWVNKLAFVAKKSTGDQAVTSKLSVLTEICAAFGLRCFQAEGAWHLVQANHFATSNYRRWRYDSTGAGKVTDSNAPNDYEDVDPRVTISNEDLIRTVATKTFLKGYNSSAVSYEHGPIQILRAPRFEPQDQLEANQFFGGGGVYPWSSAANASLHLFNDGSWGMGIDAIDADGSAYTGYAEVAVNDVKPKIANAAGTGVGTLDAAIGSTYKSTQRSQSELQSGANITFSAQVYSKSTGVGASAANWWEYTDTYIAFQVKHYGSSTRYLQWASDGSLDWTTTANWLLLKNQTNIDGWLNIALSDIESIGSDGDIEVSLGPIIANDDAALIFDKAIWDNVQITPVLADGAINNDTTTSLNFIDRSQPRPVRRSVILGDGPTSYNKGSMFSDSTLDTITQDWEETTTGHSGADTNVDHATLLGTMMLTSMRKIRPVHNAAYPGLGRVLTPLDVLNRGGALYPAWQITSYFQQEYSSGSWYEANEAAFTSDLETGVSSGSHLVSDFGRGSSGVEGFNFNRIGSSFDTLIARESDRLATVNAAATSGTTVTCTALAYALKTGDPVFFQSKKTGYIMKRIVAADAAAAATSFTVTVAFSASEPLNVGDPILPGSISGLRIDLDGVSILNTHLKNDGTNAWDGTVDATGAITASGTQGWIITRTGEAEFNDVTVRGTLSTSSLTGVLSISGAGAVSIGSDFTIDTNGLLITSGSGNVNAIRWSDGGKIESGGGPGVMTITSPGPGTGTISMIGTGVVFNVGYARLIDVSASTSAPGQAGAASLFSLAGELYTRNGTGSHYVLLNSNSTVQVSKLSTGTNGYVLTMVGGVPAWAASAAGTTTFTGLTDTPASFAGSGSYLVRVNAGATALEFVDGSTVFQPLDTQLTHLAALAPTAQVELVTMNSSGAYLSSGSDGQFLKMAFGSPSWHDTTAITAVGTITTGTWQGTAIGDTYISSAATWNAKLSDITGEPLSDLSDVTITSIASGELLKWNGFAWVNNTLSEAGIQAYNTNLAQISSISPTNGGMIYYASGAYSQLAAGANGYILRMSLGTPGWEALSGINVSEFGDNGTYIRADVDDSATGVITFNAGPKFEAGILLDHESGDLSGTAGYHTLWARSTGERLDYISGTGNVHSIVTNRKGVVNLYSRYGQTTVTGTTPVNFFADSGSFVGTSSVPASVVQAGSVFRIKAMGTRQGNASDSHTWTLKLGAVTLWSYTYTPAISFGGYLGWELDAMISVVTTGAGGTIWVQGVFQDDAGEQQFIQNTATDTYNTTSGASMQLNVNTNISTTATCEIAIIDLSRSLSTAA